MTEEFMEEVRNNYKKWDGYVLRRKDFLNNEIEKLNKIKELLNDQKVNEFADLIQYKEKSQLSYLKELKELEDKKIDGINGSLYNFLKSYMSTITFYPPFINKTEFLKQEDKYPIYCYVTSNNYYKDFSSDNVLYYRDIYWNLQKEDLDYFIIDKNKYGKKREKFKTKNAGNIIYAEENESFLNPEYFYKIQTEYVECALKEGQEKAHELILDKYSKK